MLLTIFGTRPEIIKMAPILPLLDEEFEHRFVYSSQHYSYNMAQLFFEEMGLRKPDAELRVNSSDVKKLQDAIRVEIKSCGATAVICYGDTNSSLAIALAAQDAGVPIVHLEAGLRSFDRQMPEEGNRIEIDKRSAMLFCPTGLHQANLEREHIEGKKFVVGSLIADAVKQNLKNAVQKSTILRKLHLKPQEYSLLTAHRKENVDDRQNLKCILEAVGGLGTVVYPIHPRSKEKIGRYGLKVPENVVQTEPLGYFDFLELERNAALAITDSGGVQEECMILHTPCLTIRNSTERWETVVAGGNILAGLDPFLIRQYASQILDKDSGLSQKMRKAQSPYGENVAEKIIKIIKENPGLLGI